MRDRTIRFFGLIIVWMVGGSFFPKDASSLPQFPVRFGSKIYEDHAHEEEGKTMDCRACHINPTGGGMRNQHGQQFAIQSLPMQEPTEEYKGLIESARITPFLSIGTDLRFAYLHAQKESTSAYSDSFFPMQGDLYVAFTPARHLIVYYQDGLQQNREVFGIVHGLPANTHIKFGKFLPPYGLKLDDHTSFIREKLGFGNVFGRESESGIEAGFADELWFGNAAFFNGSGVAPDDNRAKGFSATAGAKTPGFWLAGSYYHNKTGRETADAVTREYMGIYTAMSFRWLAFLGEWDRISSENPLTEHNGDAIYTELLATLSRGIVARVKYDGYDPDWDASGDHLQRITFGVDLYPYPFTEILIQYRKNIEEIDVKNDQFLVMTHFFF